MRSQEPRGLAWSPKGDEVWFAEWGALWAVSLTGKRRLVARFPGAVTLNDISRDGRVLLTLAQWHASLLVQAPGETEERDLSWFDASQPAALSRDGGTLLFTDRGGAGRRRISATPPPTCGAPTDRRRFGSGKAGPRRSRPTGSGSSPSFMARLRSSCSCRRDRASRGRSRSARSSAGGPTSFRTGRRVLIWGSAPGQGTRVFVQDLDGRDRRALPEGFHLFWYGSTVSPDGKLVAIAGPGQKLMLIPIEGGEPRPVPGVETLGGPGGLE